MYLLLSLVHPPPPSYDAGLLYGRGCPAYETVWLVLWLAPRLGSVAGSMGTL